MENSRPSLDESYLDQVRVIAKRSTCIRRDVGAIITDKRGKVLGTGYNGVPKSYPHCITMPCAGAEDASGDTRRCHAVHAEVNAMLQCANIEDAFVLYCSATPCFGCSKMIANTGIKRIVCVELYTDQMGLDVLRNSNISVEYMQNGVLTNYFESVGRG